MTFSKLKKRQKAGWILSWFLGATFILSGITKAINIPAFAYEVRMYSDAYMSETISYWTQPVAIVICAIELCVGVLAFFSGYMKISNIVMLVMLSFFVWLTGVNYFSPSIMGSIESCGCFGELIHFTPMGAFLKSFVLWGLAICNLILFSYSKSDK